MLSHLLFLSHYSVLSHSCEFQLPSLLLAATDQVAQGLIWVWGENGPDAALESALTAPALVPELEDKELLESGKIMSSEINHHDLAYGWDTFMVRRRNIQPHNWCNLRTFFRVCFTQNVRRTFLGCVSFSVVESYAIHVAIHTDHAHPSLVGWQFPSVMRPSRGLPHKLLLRCAFFG